MERQSLGVVGVAFQHGHLDGIVITFVPRMLHGFLRVLAGSCASFVPPGGPRWLILRFLLGDGRSSVEAMFVRFRQVAGSCCSCCLNVVQDVDPSVAGRI